MIRKWTVRGLLLMAVMVVTLGCNPLAASLFLLNGTDSKTPAEYPLEAKDKRSEIKVLVLCHYPGNIPEEFIGVERMLAMQFSNALQTFGAAEKMVIATVPASKLEKYQNDTPDWQTKHPTELGRRFEADYVIDLHIKSMSLYEYGSRHLYRGRTLIGVEAYKVGEEVELDPGYTSEYTCEYPEGHTPDASDMPPSKFRAAFLKRIATDLSWKFVPHTTSARFHRD
ncbi:hypothetical protein [Tuwongella immobilis]|uniref:Uncharacterized protein n=1 Tax=Tuwongella immobilis TaxID=692036 RepID=A0A6C2YKE6_9BACT|nr:hypothetical protein [Tuwongella immobilis]VIP02048.1 Uncharacterized protein OS=Planctomyces maris DSM 8797 GN=PM8797T_11966 PE=4 SV=1 [Tuwongella immobilis]VTS00231.1 Uncharacterized protein OS=Planctomyces maris DSM 8797 GN=PM8797T_11966 PE=4 SV=1 [Tuwongella immobilis]